MQHCLLASILVFLIPMVDMQNIVCSLRPERGICPFTSLRWYYNVWTRSCQPFFYGGCFGNANNFQTRQECYTRCFYFYYFR
uniref:Putative kunitz peptide n=1 Tax=Tabanus bromius TaxID=304241 RepID=A0A0K8TL02_TABBR